MGPAINHVFLKTLFTLEILSFLYFSKALLIYFFSLFSKRFLLVYGAAPVLVAVHANFEAARGV